jgi:hypothetical protein
LYVACVLLGTFFKRRLFVVKVWIGIIFQKVWIVKNNITRVDVAVFWSNLIGLWNNWKKMCYSSSNMKVDIFQMSIKFTLDVFSYLKEMHIVIYKKRRKKKANYRKHTFLYMYKPSIGYFYQRCNSIKNHFLVII